MSQNTEKYKTTAQPIDPKKEPVEPRPRRRRRVMAEPEDFWGKLRFRIGKKNRWFGRRCRRVIREVKANRFRSPTGRRCNSC